MQRNKNWSSSATGWRAREPWRRYWPAAAADMFDITMFGDEPTGNYNRILLSNVLNGSHNEDEIYLNPLSWYKENEHHASYRARAPQVCSAGKAGLRRERRRRALRQADHRNRQPAIHPSDGRDHHA